MDRTAQDLHPVKSFRGRAGYGWVFGAVLWGCATPPGVIFPPVEPALVWPSPPQPPRIRYVGQLASSTDLKSARSGWSAFQAALGGRAPVYSVVSPIAVWMSPSEELFVADTGGQAVHRFDLNRRTYAAIRETRDGRLSMPVAVVGDGAGGIYVADADQRTVHRFGPGGAHLSDLSSELLGHPSGLAFDAQSGRVYVADSLNHRMVVFGPEGRVIQSFGERGVAPGQFNYPTHLAIDGRGRLLVADSLNHRIQRFHADGTVDLVFGRRGTAPGDFALPKGVAVDRDGNIYVVDARFENIQVFDDQGVLLIAFGQEGSGPAEFWLPAGICIDRAGRIFVADTYNRRVQVFQYRSLQETPS